MNFRGTKMTAAAARNDSAARGQKVLRASFQALGMLPILVLISLMFQFLSGMAATGSIVEAFQSGRFLSSQNLLIIAQQASINTVLAAGMTFVILTGGIGLPVGSILAASAMISGCAGLNFPEAGSMK